MLTHKNLNHTTNQTSEGQPCLRLRNDEKFAQAETSCRSLGLSCATCSYGLPLDLHLGSLRVPCCRRKDLRMRARKSMC